MKNPFDSPTHGYLKTLVTTLLCVLYSQAQAACNLSSSAGSDVQICDSGSSGPLTNPAGNNTLIFPAGGSGSIVGNVSFGAGNDRIEMNSGSIIGDFNQGAGADVFRITAGTITGDVNQSDDPDDFFMSGGTLRSLTQGDGRDTFLMTGGTISNAFEDGDIAKMTGGTIGRVDMKLDDNLFDMSGGTIVNNLVTGFGKDTIIVSGGTIGGAISVSGGDDSITVSGGEVRGGIRASTGNDTLNWQTGGVIRAAVLMADGNDSATLGNLNETVLGALPLLDGGPGVDTLTFNATTTAVPGRYANWETINLSNASRLDLAGDMVLGDSVSGTGTLNVDASSTLASVSGSLRPFNSGQLLTLNNAGTLDMTTGSSSASDTLTVQGNYVGNNGRLLLQSVLGDDSSPSDKLIISRGAISGTTQINVTNLGGVGALTQQNGIEVVQASNGAVSSDTAFSQGNSLSIGAFEYYLFKGGATAGSENSWFLRSTVLSPPLAVLAAPAAPTPAAPVIPATPVTPSVPVTPTAPATPNQPITPITPTTPVTPAIPSVSPPVQPATVAPVPAIGTPPLPAPVAGAAPIPLYRLEVPNYAVVPPAAAVMTQMSLGTFHDRQGDQGLLNENGWVPAGWARVFGNDFKRNWSGTVDPTLDASLQGYQVGHDLYASTVGSGWTQRSGLFAGHSRLDGHVDGFAGGFHDRRTGKLKLEGDSLGAYWTLIDPKGWYIDAVAMGTRLDGYSRSERGVRIDTRGHVVSLSLETGYPIQISSNWVVEPQAQLISQRISLDSQDDGISRVSFDRQSFNTARLGARLKGRYVVQGMPLEPYIRTNLWRNFGGSSTVSFDRVNKVDTDIKSTTLDLGVGVIAKVSRDVSVYASADYSSDVDDNDLNGLIGNLGVRMSW